MCFPQAKRVLLRVHDFYTTWPYTIRSTNPRGQIGRWCGTYFIVQTPLLSKQGPEAFRKFAPGRTTTDDGCIHIRYLSGLVKVDFAQNPPTWRYPNRPPKLCNVLEMPRNGRIGMSTYQKYPHISWSDLWWSFYDRLTEVNIHKKHAFGAQSCA